MLFSYTEYFFKILSFTLVLSNYNAFMVLRIFSPQVICEYVLIV